MRKLALLFFLCIFEVGSQSHSVVLTWDPMPVGQSWKQVRIYERAVDASGGFVYTLRAEVAGDQTTATIKNVVPGPHTYVARSVDGWESVDSTPASVGQPDSPAQLKVTITVDIQVESKNQ